MFIKRYFLLQCYVAWWQKRRRKWCINQHRILVSVLFSSLLAYMWQPYVLDLYLFRIVDWNRVELDWMEKIVIIIMIIIFKTLIGPRDPLEMYQYSVGSQCRVTTAWHHSSHVIFLSWFLVCRVWCHWLDDLWGGSQDATIPEKDHGAGGCTGGRPQDTQAETL